MIRTIIVFIILHIGTPTQAGEITRFGENVITNVTIHEFGHALIREFDLPVLGNEENIADSFRRCCTNTGSSGNRVLHL